MKADWTALLQGSKAVSWGTGERHEAVTHSFELPLAATLLDEPPALLLVLCEALRRAALRSLRVTVCCAKRRYCSIISAWACSR